MTSTLYKQGLETRRRVLGDDYVDRALAGTDDFTAELQRMVTEYCWGEVWTRTALHDRQRSLINLGMIAALNRGHEFSTHVRGALRNGCTVGEIRGTLLQVAVYCSIPAGVESVPTRAASLRTRRDKARSRANERYQARESRE